MSVDITKKIIATISLVLCAGANASDYLPIETSGMAESVNDMLRLDAERAIITEQKMLNEVKNRLGGVPTTGAGSMSPSSSEILGTPKADTTAIEAAPARIEVLGIFGLGENLLADVAIDNVQVRFKRGQRNPLGAGRDYPYRLISINVPCVKISGPDNIVQKSCLTKHVF